MSLYPEKRMKATNQPQQNDRGKTETSPFFEPSRQNDKPKPSEDDDQGSSKSRKQGGRQMLLSFNSHGNLTNKQPLTNPTPRSDAARLSLAEIAQETVALLPGLLATRPDVGREGHLIQNPSQLDPSSGPRHSPTKIRVVDADTITAALNLQRSPNSPPPLILNMANANHAGGGFKHGALAQEEALCYRCSLFFTLKIRHYPLPERAAIYSPHILVIRESMSDGHDLLDLRQPAALPVLAAVSAPAICLPELTKLSSSKTQGKQHTYAKSSDRELMKSKMRVILRVAALNGHEQLVLGAFGCGAFRNPPWEVAEMWKAVFEEPEFKKGGWWKDVVFAVLGQGTENFDVFEDMLAGLEV